MADFIDLAKPLKLATPGTAPIAGLVVADTAALEAIDSPWLGMIVYVEANGKTYRITELKDVSVGVFTKKAVKTYEVLPDKSDLDGKADANHTHGGYASAGHSHPEYALKSEVPGAADLSKYLTITAAAETYAAKSHTHGEYALNSHNHDTVYAAVGHTHTNYENRLATLETASAAIFHLGLVRPNYDDALHLRIEKNGTAVVDTANTADRAKVKIFTGQEWVEFPSDGAGSPFSEMSVDIDLTTLGGGTHYLRYKWYNSSTGTDWVGVTFPSSGNSGGAGGGSGASDFSVYIDPTTNNWIINGEDSGVCAVGTLNVVTSIPDNPVEGTLLIT
ncbi:MAG: hypothetical protein V8T90_15455 [Victivallales bacterium]